jgi:hypothetical protein
VPARPAVPALLFQQAEIEDDVPGDSDGDGKAPLAGWPQDAVAERIAVEMRLGAAAGRPWRPDYDQLRALTGKQLRWCQKAVSKARDIANAPERGDAESSHSDTQSPASRAGLRLHKAGEAAPAGGNVPALTT